jgi:cell division septation protein DedD
MGRMMRVFTTITAAVLASAILGASGQAAPGTEPKELPPAGFSGNQYVDSAGCVFLRADLAGKTAWVPRVNRDRQPVCGYESTFPEGMLDAAAALAGGAVAPTPEPEPVAAPAAASSAPAVQPVVAKTEKAAPARKKKAARVAAPKSLALVHRKAVALSATYCADRISAAQRYLLSDGRRVTQCAESTDAPAVGYLNGLGIPGLEVSDRAPSAAEIRRAEKLDQGAYRVTYAKGKLTAAGQAAMTQGAAPAAGPYVQIGAFREAANAERAIATLKDLGLPVSVGVGGGLRVILAGPFASSADLGGALSLVRQNGYRDAFPTRG